MSQITPGRQARMQKYVPFNNDPKGVGTRTNTIMPKDVARTADGFEDPEEFFRSPGTVIDYNRSIMSIGSKTPRTPGGRSTVMADTPMTGYTDRTSLTVATSAPGRRGRLSELDLDDEGGLEADELLVDEDELGLDYPASYPTDDNLSSSRLSRPRLPAASPSINMDDDDGLSPERPSQSQRKSTIGVNYRSSPTHTTPGARLRGMNLNRDSPLRTPRGPEDVTPEELDEALASQAVVDASPEKGSSPTQTTQNRKRKSPVRSPRKSKANDRSRGVQDEEEEEEEEEERIETEKGRRDRYSVASRRSNGTRNGDGLANSDDEGSQSDNDNGPSFNYDAGADDDIGMGADDISGFVDDMADGGGAEPYDEEDDDAGMEEAAVRAEEEGGSEGEQDDSIVKKRRVARPKAAARKTAARSAPARRSAAPREGSVAPRPKKTRISQVGHGPEGDDEDGFHGNFTTRRSQRQHFAPLEWWRNEHFEYKRGPGLPVIAEVVTYPEEETLSFAEKRKASRTRGRSKKRATTSEEPTNKAEEGWDAKTDPTGIVMDFAKGQEVHRKVACPQALLDPKMVKGGTFKYQKVFGEGAFMAAGVVYIPVGMAKGAKPSKDNCYVFYLIQGAVQVSVHRTSFVMAPGAQFLVPRGNEYSIENISPDKEAQLFFAQARKIRRDEADAEVGLGEDGPSQVKVAAPASVARRGGRRSGAEDDDY